MMCHWLPGEYRNEKWPTRDGVMPWKVFEVRFPMVFTLMAQERLNVARGIGLAFADPKKSGAVRDRELKEAFPHG